MKITASTLFLLAIALATSPLSACRRPTPQAKKVLSEEANTDSPKGAAMESEVDPLERVAERLASESVLKDPRGGMEDEDLDMVGDEELGDDESSVRDSQHLRKNGPNESDALTPQIAGSIRCPKGSTVRGAAPPKGIAEWCAKQAMMGEGPRHGPYLRWDRSGRKRYEAYFVNDQLEGAETNYFPNGQASEVKEFRQGVLNGGYTKWSKDGQKLEQGRLANGKKNGSFKYWDKRGLLQAEGAFKNNKKNGLWKLYDRGGRLTQKVTFVDGKKEGKAEIFFPNGRISASGFFAENRKDGTWTFFDENGQMKARGDFVDGRKDGNWLELNQRGRGVQSVDHSNTRNNRRDRLLDGSEGKEELGFKEM